MSIILGLWSLVLEPGKTHTVTVSPAIQITNISFGKEVTGNERTVVTLQYPDFEEEEDSEDESDEEEDDDDEEGNIKLPKIVTKEIVIAILKPDVTEQVSVNIQLVEDVEVAELSITGPNAVHLVGHYVRQEDLDQDPYSDEDSDDDGEFDSDDESIDSAELEAAMDGVIEEDEEEPKKGRFQEITEKKPAAKKEAAAKVASPAVANSKKRAAAEEAEDVATSLVPKSDDATSTASDALSKNQKKKLAKKLKTSDGSAAPAPAAAAPAVVEKKEAAPAAKKAAAPTSQTLPGGLVITDAKKGDGPVAKSGKKVGMRYIGKLENGKIFDSNTKGAPLNFTLGRGEVIKGWDQGIVGMAVGGERKIVIPAALAYGKKGTGGIPGNATLYFDVKLISIK